MKLSLQELREVVDLSKEEIDWVSERMKTLILDQHMTPNEAVALLLEEVKNQPFYKE